MRKTLLIVAALMTGTSLITAAPAHAESTDRHRPQAESQRTDDWQSYKNYRTYEACMREGRELKSGGIIEDYKCDWDSPYWLLSIRK